MRGWTAEDYIGAAGCGVIFMGVVVSWLGNGWFSHRPHGDGGEEAAPPRVQHWHAALALMLLGLLIFLVALNYHSLVP